MLGWNMIQMLGEVARHQGDFVYIACSGGVDSMATCSFLENMMVEYRPVFFHHGTNNSDKAEKFLRDKFMDSLLVGRIQSVKSKDQSMEEHWRIERYKYLKTMNAPVITAHHLDDSVETWVWSSMHGTPKLPEYFNGVVYRPFLLNRKAEFESWCKRKNVEWIEDESNKNTKFTRNYIRHEMMPLVLRVNPGIHKVVRKKLLEKYSL